MHESNETRVPALRQILSLRHPILTVLMYLSDWWLVVHNATRILLDGSIVIYRDVSILWLHAFGIIFVRCIPKSFFAKQLSFYSFIALTQVNQGFIIMSSPKATTKRTIVPSKDHFDAFSYYSNDLIRMKTLLMKEDEDGIYPSSLLAHSTRSVSVNNGAPKRRRSNISHHARDNERKTVLSFEVHPSLLLDDLFLGTGETTHVVADD